MGLVASFSCGFFFLHLHTYLLSSRAYRSFRGLPRNRRVVNSLICDPKTGLQENHLGIETSHLDDTNLYSN